jgi:zinc protease
MAGCAGCAPVYLIEAGQRDAPAALLRTGDRMKPFLLAAPLMAAATLAIAEPEVTSFRLGNGMDVVVIADDRAPVVTHMVWYRVGSADDPPGKSGLAHYLEHLMFKGTEVIPEGAFSKIVAENGGQDNAFTSRDFTAYFQRIASDRLETVMRMEADRMRNVRFSEAVALTERDVILEERSQVVDNDPGSQFGEMMSAALYMHSPYRVPVIGWRHEMEGLTRDDALAFYERYYAPDNAILVVAGDVAADEVKRLAETHYGPHQPSGRPRAGAAASGGSAHRDARRARAAGLRDPAVSGPLAADGRAAGRGGADHPCGSAGRVGRHLAAGARAAGREEGRDRVGGVLFGRLAR